MQKKRLIIYLFILTIFSNVNAQIDTSFWFTAPDISQGLEDRPIFLYINSYSQPTTVKISQPANSSFTTITKVIPANSIDSVNLTPFISSIENNIANSILNNGIYISSTDKISVLYVIKANSNKEYFSLKGPKALGVDFYIPMQNFWNQVPATSPKSFSSFEIVASENNTTVLITPKTNIIGHVANTSFSITLQKGQTYSCQDTARSASTSLAGSIVSSNKPIAITIQSSGLNQLGCLSSIGDQITNSNFIGTDYIINKGTGSSEKVFILATQNGTQLNINDGNSTTTAFLNYSQNYLYSINQPISYIKSNKPIYVLHVSGFGCKLSGAQIPPFYCAGTSSAAFTRTSSDTLAINLYTRSGFENNFTLNGNASTISSSSFSIVPGTSGTIKSAKIYLPTSIVPVGSHNIITNTGDIFGLGVLNGSSLSGSSYAYVSEFSAYPTINAGSDFTICANGSASLNGFVGGGNISGIWSTNGFGGFSSPSNSLTNIYIPSQLDTTLKPVKLFLTSNGPCPISKDTLLLTVKPSPIVNASIDQIVCSNNSTIYLNGSVLGGASTGIWSSLGTGTFYPNSNILNGNYIPSVTDTANGSVKLILTATNTGICAIERDTMLVTITPAPYVNVGVSNYSVCANNPTLTINGNVGGITNTGKWTTSGNGIFNPSNISLTTNYFPSASDINSGQIKLYLNSTNNANCNQAKDSIIVYFTPSPVVNAGIDLLSCKNNASVVLNGLVSGPTTSGSWIGGNGTYFPNSTVLNATYTPSANEISAGFVNLTLMSTQNGNCNYNSDVVKITYVPKPFANFNFSNVCLNNQTAFIDFSLAGIGTINQWEWAFGDGSVSTNQNPTHIYQSPSTFTTQLVVKNTFGCTDTISKHPTVYPLPNVNFGINRICTGAFLNLIFSDSSNISAPESINQWYWDFGGHGTSNLQNPIQLFPGSGLYNISLIATSNHGCKDTLIKSTTLTPRPEAGFAYSISSGIGVTTNISFIDTSKYSTNWNWNFGDNTAQYNIKNPNNIFYSNGVFIVTQIVYDAYGCSDTA